MFKYAKYLSLKLRNIQNKISYFYCGSSDSDLYVTWHVIELSTKCMNLRPLIIIIVIGVSEPSRKTALFAKRGRKTRSGKYSQPLDTVRHSSYSRWRTVRVERFSRDSRRFWTLRRRTKICSHIASKTDDKTAYAANP